MVFLSRDPRGVCVRWFCVVGPFCGARVPLFKNKKQKKRKLRVKSANAVWMCAFLGGKRFCVCVFFLLGWFFLVFGRFFF